MDVTGYVNINVKYAHNRLPIQFGEVDGDFMVTGGLKTLVGCPRSVGGHFNCANNKLANLIGGPREVGGEYECSNSGLSTLEGAPREVGGDFSCRFNYIADLKYAPKIVGGNFDARHNVFYIEHSHIKIAGRFLIQ